MIIKRKGSCLAIEGDLTLTTVMQARAEFDAPGMLAGVDCLDLGGLAVCDSAAVALVLELQRRGLREVRNASADFSAIVQACQLDALFPGGSSGGRVVDGGA